MQEIKYRPARIKDLSILYDFEQGIIAAERPYDPTLKPGHINYYDLQELIESDNSEVVVAEVNQEIVGSGYVKIKKALPYLSFDEYAYVGFMFVKPTFRRQGISQMILEKLKAWARSKNMNELRLDVYDDNEIAVAAYEKKGMKKHMVEMRMKI